MHVKQHLPHPTRNKMLWDLREIVRADPDSPAYVCSSELPLGHFHECLLIAKKQQHQLREQPNKSLFLSGLPASRDESVPDSSNVEQSLTNAVHVVEFRDHQSLSWNREYFSNCFPSLKRGLINLPRAD
jgi:hypothetical protein